MSVRTSEISRELMRIEEDLGLFHHQIKDVFFWERVRRDVKKSIRKKKREAYRSSDSQGKKSEKLRRALLLIKNIFIKNPFLGSEKDILFWGWRRKKTESGKGIDVYCDPIIRNLDRSYVSIERPYRGEHLTPRKNMNIRYWDIIDYGSALLSKLGVAEVELSDREEKPLISLENKIEEHFGVNVDVVKIVKEDLQRRKISLPIYRKLLRKITPKVVILGLSSSGKEDFIEACKKENIPVVELQHGSISRYKLTYSFSGESREKNYFPDYYFAFGTFWKNRVEFPIRDEKVKCVGFPFFEEKKIEFSDIEPKDQLVFVSQHTIGEQLSKLASDFADQTDYKVIYKLHPGEVAGWRVKYPWLVESDLEVVEDDIPIHKLFAESKAQVGVFSTAIYEGLAFGLKTYLADLPGFINAEDLVEKGYAEKISSSDDLAGKSDLLEENKLYEVNKFFQENSVMNIIKELEKIIED